MTKALPIVWIVLSMLLAAACLPDEPPNEANASAKVLPLVVRISGPRGMGSGLIIDDGLILTNRHVVETGDSYTVETNEGQQYEGKVAAKNTILDMALLRFPGKASSKAVLAEIPKMKTGEPVLVVGYPLDLKGQATVTRGLFSAVRVGEPMPGEWVQTDAAVNPGNSGGPLINLKGEIVGLITLGEKISADRRPVEGINFALSSTMLSDFLPGMRLAAGALPKDASSGSGELGKEISSFLKYYDDAESRAYAEGDPSVLKGLCSSAILGSISPQVRAQATAGMKRTQQLMDFQLHAAFRLPGDYVVAEVVERWLDALREGGTLVGEKVRDIPQYPVLKRLGSNWQLVGIQFRDPATSPPIQPFPEKELLDALDLKAVPRPPDSRIVEWQRERSSSTIVYEYDWQKHSKSDIANHFISELPKVGWVRDSFPSSGDIGSMSFQYRGPQPLQNLQIQLLDNATAAIRLNHAMGANDDLSLFAGRSLHLGADIPNAYDLKAIPRPPDSVIADWKSYPTYTSIVYRYDWEKHSKAEIIDFYLSELPKLGWVRNNWSGSVEKNREDLRATFDYKGPQPLNSTTVSVGQDATVRIEVNHPAKREGDLSLFVGRTLDLGSDIPNGYDLKAIPRPPDSVIADWKSYPTFTTIVYRYNWERSSRADVIGYYLSEMPKRGWVLAGWNSSPEKARAEGRVSFDYRGPQPLSSVSITVSQDGTVRMEVNHPTKPDGDMSLFMGNPVNIGRDLTNAYDLKAIPRPPDSAISGWKTYPTTTTIVYRYNWEKHLREDMINFYLSELPKRGWVLGGWNATPEKARNDLRAYFVYGGPQPLTSVNISVGQDATVTIEVNHPTKRDGDLSLFVGQQLALGTDVPNSRDLKAVPRPPDSVIAEWRSYAANTTIIYRYNWEKFSQSQVMDFYLAELPKRGWALSGYSASPEKARSEGRAYFEYKASRALSSMNLTIGQDALVKVEVNHPNRQNNDMSIFVGY